MQVEPLMPTRRKTYGIQAYDSLREAIITLRLEPGQMIYEPDLATEMGISRTPVREAFRMLLTEEFIDVLPQKGARVELISEKKVEEARVVRESLEVMAFRQLARNWNMQDATYANAARQLNLLLDQQRDAARRNDPFQFLKWDEAFHREFLLLTGNQTLLSIVFQMRGHLNRLRYLMLEELSQMDVLVTEHEEILAAVIACDEQRTISLMENHLRKVNEGIPELKQRFPNYFKP